MAGNRLSSALLPALGPLFGAWPPSCHRAGERISRSGRHHGRQSFTVISFTVAGGKIAEIDAIADPGRVCRLAAAVLTAG